MWQLSSSSSFGSNVSIVLTVDNKDYECNDVQLGERCTRSFGIRQYEILRTGLLNLEIFSEEFRVVVACELYDFDHEQEASSTIKGIDGLQKITMLRFCGCGRRHQISVCGVPPTKNNPCYSVYVRTQPKPTMSMSLYYDILSRVMFFLLAMIAIVGLALKGEDLIRFIFS